MKHDCRRTGAVQNRALTSLNGNASDFQEFHIIHKVITPDNYVYVIYMQQFYKTLYA